jgi:hypothetical protein
MKYGNYSTVASFKNTILSSKFLLAESNQFSFTLSHISFLSGIFLHGIAPFHD